jgi:hypothetical protein
MSALKLFSAAALVFGLGTMPLAAQAVVSEPGYCAFFYPYANCQNKGPGNPTTDPNYPRGPSPDARAGSSIGAAPTHIRRHRAQ